MRTLINKDGVTFDAEKNYVFFAEDWNDLVAFVLSISSNIGENGSNIVHIGGSETIEGLKTFINTIKGNILGGPFLVSNPNNFNSNQVREEVATNGKIVISETWTRDVANNRGMRWDWFDDVDGAVTGYPLSKSLWGYLTDVNGNNQTYEQYFNVRKIINGQKQFLVNAQLEADNFKVVQGKKNAGDYIELDGMRLSMATTGNKSFGLSVASGSVTLSGSTTAINHENNNLYSKFDSLTVTTSFTRFNDSWVLGGVGNKQEVYFYNNSNSNFYKITCIVGPDYTPCSLKFERLQ